MQVYRGMDIGSAKITREEMQGVPHHMIDILEPWESFSVADFVENCKRITHEIYDRGHIPVVTGGTGFYIQALLKDVDFSTPVREERCGDSDLSVKETGNVKEEPSEEATSGETPGKYRAYLKRWRGRRARHICTSCCGRQTRLPRRPFMPIMSSVRYGHWSSFI